MQTAQRTLYVIETEPCDDCEGIGHTIDPTWQGFWAEEDRICTTEETRDVAGLRDRVVLFFESRGMSAPPLVSIECECGGTGVLVKRIPKTSKMMEAKKKWRT